MTYDCRYTKKQSVTVVTAAQDVIQTIFGEGLERAVAKAGPDVALARRSGGPPQTRADRSRARIQRRHSSSSRTVDAPRTRSTAAQQERAQATSGRWKEDRWRRAVRLPARGRWGNTAREPRRTASDRARAKAPQFRTLAARRGSEAQRRATVPAKSRPEGSTISSRVPGCTGSTNARREQRRRSEHLMDMMEILETNEHVRKVTSFPAPAWKTPDGRNWTPQDVLVAGATSAKW